MPTPTIKQLITLKAIANKFETESNQKKLKCLKQLEVINLQLNANLLKYTEELLFICAYPPDVSTRVLAENELKRTANFLKKNRLTKIAQKHFTNSGLPYTTGLSHFSHDFVSWLFEHPDCKCEISSFEGSSFDLNEVLKLTLPSVEKSETTAGLTNTEFLEVLGVKKNQQLPFLLTELSKLDHIPYIKDHLFDGLGLYINIFPKDKLFSKAYNRIPIQEIYYHQDLIKAFDSQALIKSMLPEPKILNSSEKNNLVKVIKNSMALTDRETDPTTYLDSETLRLYELERGITIAIYGMISRRHLPLESYVGYTLFKNGFPAAYGGGWVFGERLNFGINIFESFRGGESGYILCQLLRVYSTVFSVSYFEIEPYQFGLDNPEGITSGAFWFYYKYGFRPLDKQLLKISNDEQQKIKKKKNYRTSPKILEHFTESNIALNLGSKIPMMVPDITSKITIMINRNYNGNRIKAGEDCILNFRNKTGIQTQFTKAEQRVLEEVALWCEAMKIESKPKLNLMQQMVKTKPVDLYRYQQLLLDFFK